MANLTITNSFTSGTKILSAEVNTNFTDISGYINPRNSGSTDWDFVSSSGLITAKDDISLNDGTAAGPALFFTSGTTDGVYRIGTNNIGIALNGTLAFNLKTTGIGTPDGTAADPAIGVDSESTGFFLLSASNLHLSIADTDTYLWNASQFSTTTALTQSRNLGSASAEWGTVFAVTGTFSGNVAAVAGTFTGQLQGDGTATNDNASTGQIGETVSSTVGTTSFPTSGQFGDATSISLTAGDWLVSVIGQAASTTDTVTDVNLGVSTTAGNDGTGLTTGDTFVRIGPTPASTGSVRGTGYIVPKRFSLSGTTTVYLKFSGTYTSTAPTFQGARIQAVRIR